MENTKSIIVSLFFRDSNVNVTFKQKNVPEKLKDKILEDFLIVNDLNDLHDKVQNEEKNNNERAFIRNTNSNITFMDAKIEITEDEVDDKEVSFYNLQASALHVHFARNPVLGRQ